MAVNHLPVKAAQQNGCARISIPLIPKAAYYSAYW